ncbi:MAG TPA: S49 family peptidase [Pseudorhizobium sp.]|nr:S49 family peptidase [Pseudorhizobium sp.]
MSILFHIADRALNRPLLLTPEKAQVIMSVLAGRIGLNAPEASRFVGDSAERVVDADGVRVKTKPYRVQDGVGIITITGSLVNRGAWIGASSGLTSYEGIGHQLKTIENDDSVHSVIIDEHSPGGEATGAFETAALVRKLSAKKRTVALVNGMACSAAYAIASGASEIVTTETGVSGSIGVVMLHADYSKWLAKEGVDPTLIFAGAHKVDGNPFEPLPEDVRDELQREVTAFYDLFLETVAKGRGNRLTAEAARATEARTFIGQAAVDAGVADRLGTFEDVLSELTRSAPQGSGRSLTTRRTSMENTGTPAADAGISKADHDAAVNAAADKGRAEGAQAATDRLSAALGADGVKGDAGRMAAALDLAVKSPAMSGDDVAAFVVANVASAQATSTTPAAGYESGRMAGAGLAAPGGDAPPRSGLSARIDARIAKMKPGS